MDQVEQRLQQSAEAGKEVHSVDLQEPPEDILPQKDMQREDNDDPPATGSSANEGHAQDGQGDPKYDIAMDFWEPKPPKVLMEDPNATPLELLAQIQLYATTEFVWRGQSSRYRYILTYLLQATFSSARLPCIAIVAWQPLPSIHHRGGR